MALNPKVAPTVDGNAMLDLIGNAADSGKLQFYDGTQPLIGGDAITTQTKLVEFTLNSDAFTTAAANQIVANAITNVNAIATGTASWFRVTKSDGTTPLLDGSIGTTASFDFQVATTSVTVGDSMSCPIFVISID